jgi:hypothetical protein
MAVPSADRSARGSYAYVGLACFSAGHLRRVSDRLIERTVLWDGRRPLTKPELQSLSGLSRIWFEPGATQQYYPLLHSAFWLEHKLGRLGSRYHIVDPALAFDCRITGLRHPGQAQDPRRATSRRHLRIAPGDGRTVAWISEQKKHAFRRVLLDALLSTSIQTSRARPRYYSTALGLFTLGLLTKTVTATLPAALLLIFWWHGADCRGSPTRSLCAVFLRWAPSRAS